MAIQNWDPIKVGTHGRNSVSISRHQFRLCLCIVGETTYMTIIYSYIYDILLQKLYFVHMNDETRAVMHNEIVYY